MKPPIKTGGTSRASSLTPPDPNAFQSSFATYLGAGWTDRHDSRRRRYEQTSSGSHDGLRGNTLAAMLTTPAAARKCELDGQDFAESASLQDFRQPLCRLFSSLISRLGANRIRYECNTFLLPAAAPVAREYASLRGRPFVWCASEVKQ
jgi:hypothetical protein